MLLVLELLYGVCTVSAQSFSLYLIGDAGEDTVPGPALLLLESQLKDEDEHAAVIFLGDNCYPEGLPPVNSKQREESEMKLRSQLDRLQNFRGMAFMIPGNHDWRKSKWQGLRQVQEESAFVHSYLASSAFSIQNPSSCYLPKAGFPGPASVLVDSTLNIRIVVYDAQWWLQRQWFHAAAKEKGKSYREMSDEFFASLRDTVLHSREKHEHLILASHHPLMTAGNHGLRKNTAYILATFTPLIIFRPMGLNRLFRQDIPSNAYRRLADSVLNILALHPSAFMVAGHEHSLQVFNYRDGNTLVVSGAGSKTSAFAKKPSAFPDWKSDSSTGFFKLTFEKDMPPLLRVYTPDSPAGSHITFPIKN